MSTLTPVNQVRLTNVAIVKLSKGGKKFEIACYRNKVIAWRNKVETDIKEVLQIDSIFSNVSKGMLASKKDLMNIFNTDNYIEICQEILEKGDLQISEEERVLLYETMFKDIATIIVDKTINPETGRQYTFGVISSAMKQLQFSVNINKSSKSQALELIRKLKEVMPIARENMKLRITYKRSDSTNLKRSLYEVQGIVSFTESESVSVDNEEFIDLIIDPEAYRKIEDIIKTSFNDARIEIIQLRSSSAVSTTSESQKILSNNEEEILDSITKNINNQKGSSKKSTTIKNINNREKKSKDGEELSKLLTEITGTKILDSISEEEDEFMKPSNSKAKVSIYSIYFYNLIDVLLIFIF